MNRSQKSESNSFFSRHKVSRSSTSINLSIESISKGTEASSRELREKDSVFTEIRANSPISSFNLLSFRRAFQESSKPSVPHAKDSADSESRYLTKITRLNEEIQIMNQQLESAYEQINELTFQINEINRKHSLQVQIIHENNQKKLTELQNESKLIIKNSELNLKNKHLRQVICEKEKEMQQQQKKFNENVDYLTQQYEKKLRFKENEHNFVIENLKSQFVDVIDEMKNKFFNEIQMLQKKYAQDVKDLQEVVKGVDLEDFEEDKEEGDGFGAGGGKVQDSLPDLEIIEELSFQQNLSLNPFEQSIEASNEFDKSLKQLISQISFHDLSMSELLTKNIDKVFIASFLCFIVALVIEIAAVDALQESSSSYIQSLQDGWTESSKNFFQFISIASEGLIMVFGFLYYIQSGSKNSLLCVYLTYTSTWLGDLLKMALSHPRPFWFSSNIEGFSCASDFGSPSGHAGTIGSIIIFFFLLSYLQKQKLSLINTFVTSSALGMLALDRNYLGVHFYFQVLLGYAMAFSAAALFLMPRTWDLMQKTMQSRKLLILFHVLVSTLLACSVLVYFTKDPEMKEEWKKNFGKRCSGEINAEKALFKSLSESTCIVICAGFSSGIYLDWGRTQSSVKYKAASLALLVLGAGSEFGFEYLIKTLPRLPCFLLLCAIRYLVGLYVTALIPLALSKCFKAPHEGNKDSTIPLIKL